MGCITVTDLFCGGGGSSTGAIAIPGVEVIMAANHNDLAVEVHNLNHPDADHAAVDLHEEDPRYFPPTRMLWASPECTKWSTASGGLYAAVSMDADLLELLDPDLVAEDETAAIVRRSRLLMFDVLRFVEHHRYEAVVVENVVDVATNARYAAAWELWLKSLRNLGYRVQVVSLNSMHAQVHGAPAPQSRDRLYVVAMRQDTPPINLHRVLRPSAWCPKCETVIEAQQAWKPGRTVGKYRVQYVYQHGSCGTTVEPGYLPAAIAIDWSLPGRRIGDRDRPLADKTRARIAAGIARYWRPLITPAGGTWNDTAVPVDQPHRTITTRETSALVVPLEGRAGDRCGSTAQPLRTQTTRHNDALVTPFLTDSQYGGRHWPVTGPSPTQTTYDTASIIRPPFIAELRGGGSDARPVSRPLSTVTASGNHHGLVTPYYGASVSATSTDRPIGTLTTVDRYALITRHNSSRGDGAEMTTPALEYMRTLTTTAQQSIITPGDMDAARAQVDDCYFRMLEPSEVAAGMAFPPNYIWRGSRRERVRLAGNAVTPPAARDLVAAVAEALIA